MQVRESWHNVGSRIRTIRKQNKLTLRQLAKGCNLSTNAISLVERGQVAPTVETLCKIAGALGVRASSFLQEICPNEISIIRASVDVGSNASLSVQDSCPSSCWDIHQDQGIITSYWQESVLCLSGEAEFEDSDGQTHRLSPGDRLVCNGNALQRWRNFGENPATLVMILTPQTKLSNQNDQLDS
jgi:transcriptional regulator with XRE-family HTH domain